LRRIWPQIKEDCIQLPEFPFELQIHQHGLIVRPACCHSGKPPTLEQLLMKGVAFNQHL
jgi:hypothetical protein